MDAKEIVEIARSAQPIAEEVVRQYVIRAWLWAAGGGLMCLLGVIGAIFGARGVGKSEHEETALAWGSLLVAGIVGIVVGFILAISNLGNALAPLPSLLGR